MSLELIYNVMLTYTMLVRYEYVYIQSDVHVSFYVYINGNQYLDPIISCAS